MIRVWFDSLAAAGCFVLALILVLVANDDVEKPGSPTIRFVAGAVSLVLIGILLLRT